MKKFEGKSIVLGAPPQYGFADLIEQELRYQGFHVYNISLVQHEFRYKNFVERLNCYIHKNFLGRKDYKNYLKFKRVEDRIRGCVEAIPYADYALFIRPDQYSEEVIQAVRNKVDQTIGYQWDGLDRFPEVYKRIDLFDRFFVFDPKDVASPKVQPITNFYTNSFDIESHKAYESDAYYLGSYLRTRAPQVEEMVMTLQQLGLTVKYHICQSGKRKPHFRHLNTTGADMNYRENLRFAFNSKVLLDVSLALHHGLSFRTFEAIGFEKKLITTNEKIQQYDFYHPNNVFIWKRQSRNKLQDFLNAPYVKLAPHIKERYSFNHWINSLLSDAKVEPVMLPSVDWKPVFAY